MTPAMIHKENYRQAIAKDETLECPCCSLEMITSEDYDWCDFCGFRIYVRRGANKKTTGRELNGQADLNHYSNQYVQELSGERTIYLEAAKECGLELDKLEATTPIKGTKG